MTENGVGPDGTEPPGGESERIKGQHSSTFAEDDGEEQASGSLNHLAQRGARWKWKKVTVAVDSAAAEIVTPRNIFTEIQGVRLAVGPQIQKGHFLGPLFSVGMGPFVYDTSMNTAMSV